MAHSIPFDQLDQFKTLCTTFSELLPGDSIFIGRKLYNVFARSLGYSDFNALLHESKGYHGKTVSPHELYGYLHPQIHSQLSAEMVLQANAKSPSVQAVSLYDSDQVLTALKKALMLTFTAERGRCPLLTWIEAGEMDSGILTTRSIDCPEHLPCKVFALHVPGCAMADEYPAGCYIYVDPDKKPESGSDVVVRLGSDGMDVTFKRLTSDGASGYILESLDDSYGSLGRYDDEWMSIIGVVVAKRIEGEFRPSEQRLNEISDTGEDILKSSTEADLTQFSEIKNP